MLRAGACNAVRGVKAPVNELQYIYSNSESVAAIVETADQIQRACVLGWIALIIFLGSLVCGSGFLYWAQPTPSISQKPTPPKSHTVNKNTTALMATNGGLSSRGGPPKFILVLFPGEKTGKEIQAAAGTNVEVRWGMGLLWLWFSCVRVHKPALPVTSHQPNPTQPKPTQPLDLIKKKKNKTKQVVTYDEALAQVAAQGLQLRSVPRDIRSVATLVYTSGGLLFWGFGGGGHWQAVAHDPHRAHVCTPMTTNRHDQPAERCSAPPQQPAAPGRLVPRGGAYTWLTDWLTG